MYKENDGKQGYNTICTSTSHIITGVIGPRKILYVFVIHLCIVLFWAYFASPIKTFAKLYLN